jgi:hypothetical protein
MDFFLFCGVVLILHDQTTERNHSCCFFFYFALLGTDNHSIHNPIVEIKLSSTLALVPIAFVINGTELIKLIY